MDKKDEIPNSTIHREATCQAEERKQKTTGEKKGKGLISGATNVVQGYYGDYTYKKCVWFKLLKVSCLICVQHADF